MRPYQTVWRTSARLATVVLSLLLAVAALGLKTDRFTAFLLGFLITGSFLVSVVYLWILLRPLVVRFIPPRARAKLNSLVERVVILDEDRQLALANAEFADLVSQSVEELHADTCQAGGLPGLSADAALAPTLTVRRTAWGGDSHSGPDTRSNSDELSAIESKNTHLRTLLEQLKQSRAEIQRQNLELKAQATKDPLTGCLNRRAFFAEFETYWNAATRYGHPLSCVMVDVDNFKTINDRYGHGIGDQVLQQVAEALKASVRGVDLVCRYGGEEFCILLPHTDAQDAFEAAERFRQAIASRPLTGIPVTASFGTSSIFLGARELHDLLDQADKALYAAKREGRNRVVLWDPSLPEDAGRRSLPAEPVHARDDRPDVPIPFHAVTALLSALAYRDPYTAEHSRRVADLCVATANGLLSQSQCYVLEVAALLHDIGKLGVADAILRKPGPLTDLEWKAIRTHEKIGEEIINAAFTCQDVATTVRCHHLWYRGGEQHSRRGRGEAIPLGARILAIADAYDAMVSDRVYRKERSRAEAFAELRRCAGEQFDPLLVERFIEVVQARDDSRTQPTLCVSKQTALRIGMQIENLACSLDSHDLDTLAQMAGQLHATAVENGIAPMAKAAAQLEQTLAEERDWVTLMQQAMDLMELCRSTYRAYLPRVGPAPAANPEEIESELAVA